jgi:hypothetical protein
VLFFVFIQPQAALGEALRKKRDGFFCVVHLCGVGAVGLQKQLDAEAFAAVAAGHHFAVLEATTVAATLETGKFWVAPC